MTEAFISITLIINSVALLVICWQNRIQHSLNGIQHEINTNQAQINQSQAALSEHLHERLNALEKDKA